MKWDIWKVAFVVGSLLTCGLVIVNHQERREASNPGWLPINATDHVSLGGQWHIFKINVDGKSHIILAFKTLNTEVTFTELREYDASGWKDRQEQ